MFSSTCSLDHTSSRFLETRVDPNFTYCVHTLIVRAAISDTLVHMTADSLIALTDWSLAAVSHSWNYALCLSLLHNPVSDVQWFLICWDNILLSEEIIIIDLTCFMISSHNYFNWELRERNNSLEMKTKTNFTFQPIYLVLRKHEISV